MKTIVAESDAVTLMPMSLIARELRDRALATLPIEAPWPNLRPHLRPHSRLRSWPRS